MIVLAALGVGGAEYYTGRSNFCGSCHVMAPYYKSWQRDAHAVKAKAACIDCHYAPGERHTVRAKLRGLSQLAACLSDRTEHTRLRTRVQDSSCLREGCHARRDFVDKTYSIRSVGFTHRMHLGADPVALAALAGNARPMERSTTERDIRFRLMGNLRCTACHACNGDTRHFSVRSSVCYLCHFANQPRNTDTARCLSCHSPSALVHGNVTKASQEIAASAPSSMDHAAVIAGHVDCVSCHANVVRGTGRVPRQRCAACHNLARYYEKFDANLNVETVSHLHAVHTANLHASCTECHEEVRHGNP
jgi:nitrate/TMAO reductase-like tetraheme cytochrome c subunit